MPQNPPLYLHITSTTKEGLDSAIAKIDEMIKQELPQLVDERRFRRREQQEPVERDEYGRVGLILIIPFFLLAHPLLSSRPPPFSPSPSISLFFFSLSHSWSLIPNVALSDPRILI